MPAFAGHSCTSFHCHGISQHSKNQTAKGLILENLHSFGPVALAEGVTEYTHFTTKCLLASGAVSRLGGFSWRTAIARRCDFDLARVALSIAVSSGICAAGATSPLTFCHSAALGAADGLVIF